MVLGSRFCSATLWLLNCTAPTSQVPTCPERDVSYTPRTPPVGMARFSIVRNFQPINTIGRKRRKELFSTELPQEKNPERTLGSGHWTSGFGQQTRVSGSVPDIKCTLVLNRNRSLRDGLQAWFKTFIITARAYPIFKWGDSVLIPSKGCHLLNPCYHDCMLWPSRLKTSGKITSQTAVPK